MIEINGQEAALNAIRVKLQELTAEYAHGTEIAQDRKLRGLLAELGREREKLAELLLPHIQKVGLPKDADPEHVGLRNLVERFKTAFSTEKDATLAGDLSESEGELLKIIADAHERGVPAASLTVLHSTETCATRAQKELEAFS